MNGTPISVAWLLNLSTLSDERLIRSMRRTGFFCLAMLFWAPVFAAVYWLLGSARSTAILIVAGAAGCGLLWLLRVSRLPHLVGHLIAFLVFAVLTGISFVTGGLTAPAQTWMITVPVIAVLLCGLSSGAIWLVIVGCELGALYLTEFWGGRFPSDLVGNRLEILQLLSLLGAVLCTFSLVYFFELAERVARVRIDDALIRAEKARERNASLIQSLPNPFIGLDSKDRVVRWNQAAEKLFEISASHALGQNLFELETGLPERLLSESLAQLRSDGTSITLGDVGYLRSDLTRGQLELRLAMLEESTESPAEVLLLVSDLTARARAEADHTRLFEILEASRDFVATTTHDGRISYINSGGRHLLGLAPEQDTSSLRLHHVFPAHVTAQLSEEIFAFASKYDCWNGEVDALHRSGESKSVWMSVVAHKPAGTYVEYYSMIARDLTEKKKSERLFQEQESRLRQKQRMESISSLAGGIAHEFNNLLQIIRGYTQFSIEDQEARGATCEDLKQVLNASDRAARLTQQLLSFANSQNPVNKQFTINELVAGLAESIQPLLGSAIDLQFQLSPTNPSIRGDEAQLQQVLVNLCNNARDAMQAGGTLTIETDVVSTEELFDAGIDLAPSENGVRIRVRDTGPGIPSEILPRIFDPFFTTKAVGEGTGMGLAMVFAVVQQHGGMVRVESEPGRTTFEIYLPVTELTSEGGDPSSPDLGRVDSELILIAEEDPRIRQFAQTVLQDAGYRTIAVCNGSEAVQIFRDNTDAISLLLVDLAVPMVDGQQVLRQVREIDPNVGFILCSGAETNRPAAARNGPCPWLQKPLASQSLLMAVRQELDQRRAVLPGQYH